LAFTILPWPLAAELGRWAATGPSLDLVPLATYNGIRYGQSMRCRVFP
jgi:hypothetical protein